MLNNVNKHTKLFKVFFFFSFFLKEKEREWRALTKMKKECPQSRRKRQ
jgi:hypothetical protein